MSYSARRRVIHTGGEFPAEVDIGDGRFVSVQVLAFNAAYIFYL